MGNVISARERSMCSNRNDCQGPSRHRLYPLIESLIQNALKELRFHTNRKRMALVDYSGIALYTDLLINKRKVSSILDSSASFDIAKIVMIETHLDQDLPNTIAAMMVAEDLTGYGMVETLQDPFRYGERTVNL